MERCDFLESKFRMIDAIDSFVNVKISLEL